MLCTRASCEEVNTPSRLQILEFDAEYKVFLDCGSGQWVLYLTAIDCLFCVLLHTPSVFFSPVRHQMVTISPPSQPFAHENSRLLMEIVIVTVVLYIVGRDSLCSEAPHRDDAADATSACTENPVSDPYVTAHLVTSKVQDRRYFSRSLAQNSVH